VVELRKAYVAAGGECPSWDENDAITAAAQSGTCSDEIVLSTYSSDADTRAAISTLKSLGAGMIDATYLEGKNWIVNAPDAAKVRKKMGGTLVSTKSD